ncbi:MAG: anthranilate phosphoribosyltransferase [Calditrichia bacterium]
MLKKAINTILNASDLTRQESFDAMETIMSGEATDAQIGAFLIAMRMKGEQPEEIAGLAKSMRGKARRVELTTPETVDLVGTGGDGKHTFNITTTASFVAAGAGLPVAKHGNRSVSSKCGSADVLKELGVKLQLSADQMSACLAETGIAFLFAPGLHPAMKYAIGPRREIGVRSVFNILGPITNPAGVKRQLIGVYEKPLAPLLAEVLRQLGSEHVMLVHSEDGMDEISLAAPTFVAELKDGHIREQTIQPEDFGITRSAASLEGGDAVENANIMRSVLSGEASAYRDVVILNAAAGLIIGGRAASFSEAAKLAAESIDSGAAKKKLDALIDFTKGQSN